MEELYKATLSTPIGKMEAICNDAALLYLNFTDNSKRESMLKGRFEDLPEVEEKHHILTGLQKELDAYFDGELRSFSTPIKASGSPFQEKVWAALLQVPYGEKRSYMDQSKILGDPKAIRAVAKANGDNPIAILIPCHRILGSNGEMTGYSGGLHRKTALLELENPDQLKILF